MITNYTHNDIRAFAADNANGTICELPLFAVKNLESAVYKRKSITTTEREALLMLIQCADEIREHLNNKPIDDSKRHLPRELRDGLKREVVTAMVEASKGRLTWYSAFDTVLDTKKGDYWAFDAESDRLFKMW